jgi:hypothetical protein
MKQTLLSEGVVVRVSRGTFDPSRLADVQRMSSDTARYLVPAIQRLPGLIEYFAAIAPAGSIVHVSIWESETAAQQMASLKEMIVDARRAAEAVGVVFTPIVNHPLSWFVEPKGE